MKADRDVRLMDANPYEPLDNVAAAARERRLDLVTPEPDPVRYPRRTQTMFKIVTRNSIYTLTPESNGFTVRRTADQRGRRVADDHYHFIRSLKLTLGEPCVTDSMRTTPVAAIFPFAPTPRKVA